ncbi:uncharacterized protein L969DRAFT_85141 [Mixia osmundae IAM 14324]|uniref:EF-hand domain-containing protein n=1 Tax=Mixia osmundae (strain CBS 9802 / IAM 14324 / JCM 22182 / KY 12970) TaxID=764103 RepID=G7DY04_MIXOS|nr:uncharacterized protein L969DRAFT_85141 [Mixia osmundae IAM 14324]KEI41364.1 hypothetical protein L969DRAFT_85141 [Mixia osmundae IAM 14324]GAA95464.1 hypothetical protein E5Q_02118 [Mixia osmundae IAM 14324]
MTRSTSAALGLLRHSILTLRPAHPSNALDVHTVSRTASLLPRRATTQAPTVSSAHKAALSLTRSRSRQASIHNPAVLRWLASRRTLASSATMRAAEAQPVSSSSAPNRSRSSVLDMILLRGRNVFLRVFFLAFLSIIVGSVTLTLTVLLYDAFTYSSKHVDNVPINPVALNPKRGGPKNLKIAEVLVDDEETSDSKSLMTKPRLVIVGGGWGAVGVLKSLYAGDYHVVCISPENYNCFTPLLPAATVGTVEPRSLVEPLRRLLAGVNGHFIQAHCVDIDMSERLIEVSPISSSASELTSAKTGERPSGDKADKGENFYVPYDKLVIAVGATSATHGVPGLEHCFQLKTISDALAIRRRFMENLEAASLPSTSEEERKRLLSVCVAGGGPTGVEFASEIYDCLSQDVLKYFPKILKQDASVHIIQSRDHILNTYAEKISEYAEQKFNQDGINTILNARVKEVGPQSITYTVKGADKSAKPEEHTIPAGLVLWSTGLAMNPFTVTVAQHLPNQYHKHALEVDSHLRVIGAPLGTVYALGDASTIETNLVDHLLEFVEKCDGDNDGKINYTEFEEMIKLIQRKFPTSQIHINKVRKVFDKYDSDKDGVMGLNDLQTMFAEISSKMTALPATAQVAAQQGKYLGKKLSALSRKAHDAMALNDIYDDIDDVYYKPFSYNHLGSLASLGTSAVFDFNGYSFAGGLVAMYLWRSIYLSEQVSTRTRMLLMLDWTKRGIWGRDLSKI